MNDASPFAFVATFDDSTSSSAYARSFSIQARLMTFTVPVACTG